MTLRHAVRNVLHQISCELSVVRKNAMYVHALQEGESLNLDCQAVGMLLPRATQQFWLLWGGFG